MNAALRLAAAMFAIAAATGCDGSTASPDADPPDAPLPDAPPPPTAATAPPVSLAPVAGRVTGGRWTVDVQMGAAVEQRPTRHGRITASSAAPHVPAGATP
jgi:hypothetical protein